MTNLRRATQFDSGIILRTAAEYSGGLRANEDGALITCDGHAGRYESSSRGQIYTAMTPVAGTVMVTANACDPNNNLGPAAGAATVLSVLNPIGSNVNLEILRGWIFTTSAIGTAPGFFMWCGCQTGVSITAAEATAVKRPAFVSQAISVAKAWTQAALTGGRRQELIRPFAASYDNDSTLQDGKDVFWVDYVDGSIVVPEGALITLAYTDISSATSWAIGAGIQYAEVPYPS